MSDRVFRFAPSPNGYLHLGHAYSALLNADAAAATGSRLLLRIEDIDRTRARADFEAAIFVDLAWLGLIQWVAVPDLLHWSLLLATGVFGSLGHWVFIKAHEVAPAPVLAPFVYSQLIWMTALGYVIFGDIPDRATMIGASVIVASGLYLLYRERRAARATAPVAAPPAGPDGV